MKVVILAGGLGTRMREETEFRPKPMVEVGGKPVLWHIMKTYASHGHTDFVICTGYKGEQIKDYFYNYASRNSDFTVRLGHNDSATFHKAHDEFEWSVTVADTGQETPTGGRIKQVEKYLGGERFLATYGDGIANVNISELLATHERHGRISTVTTATPRSRFGLVEVDSGDLVLGFSEKPKLPGSVNIGYFVFEPGIFDYLNNDSVLEETSLTSLAKASEIGAYKHTGFWQPMDTFRESKILNDLWATGRAPWKSW